MISTPLSATTSKYEKDQIADHDVADFVIDGGYIGKNIYDVKTIQRLPVKIVYILHGHSAKIWISNK